MTRHGGWLKIAQHPILTGRDLRVFLGLRSLCDGRGVVTLFQRELAVLLDEQTSNVATSITRLRSYGILLPNPNRFKKCNKGIVAIHPEYL